jgi:hypothetical protein
MRLFRPVRVLGMLALLAALWLAARASCIEQGRRRLRRRPALRADGTIRRRFAVRSSGTSLGSRPAPFS